MHVISLLIQNEKLTTFLAQGFNKNHFTKEKGATDEDNALTLEQHVSG